MVVRFVYNTLRNLWINDNRLDFQCELSRLVSRERWLLFIHQSILNHAARQLEQACRQYSESHRNAAVIPDGNVMQHADAATLGKSVQYQDHGIHSPAFPRKKSKTDFCSSFTLSCPGMQIRDKTLLLSGQPGIRPIRIVQSRPLPRTAYICSATISRNASGQYYVSLLCRITSDQNDATQIQSRNKSMFLRSVGLDYSLSKLFIASDPELHSDPEYLLKIRDSRERIAKANQKLSRMKYGSNNYYKQKRLIARMNEKVRAQRQDYLQKLSTQVADRYDVVCVETLNLVEMEQACHGFARHVADSGWAEFIRMLDYKLKDRGKFLIRTGKWFASSKICHECSYLYHELKLSERSWVCPVCGEKHDRDVNASRNIRDEGLRILRSRQRTFSPKGSKIKPYYSRNSATGFTGVQEPETIYQSEQYAPFQHFQDQEDERWMNGPYGWEFQACDWDRQFYVGCADDITEPDITPGLHADNQDNSFSDNGSLVKEDTADLSAGSNNCFYITGDSGPSNYRNHAGYL